MKAWIVTLAAVALAGLASPATAQQKAEKADPKDRQVYNQLISEIRTAHVKLAQSYKRGVDEARENGGQASVRTRAEIVSLRDEIDRKSVRLMLVADRHGWAVPQFRLEDFENEAAEKEPAQVSLTDQFFPPDPRITQGLAGEAKLMAAKVYLPIIPAAPAARKD